jgi:hypothetical protein
MMSVTTKFYDLHTLYVDCGAISKKNLDRILRDAIIPLKTQLNTLGIHLDTFHELKLVVNKEGISLGKAYLWVRDPQLYNILNGKNADGSERINTYADPDWIEPASPVDGGISDFKIPEGTNWGDLVEEEEELQAPIITVKLPSLVQFNQYQYTEEETKLANSIILTSLYKDTLLYYYNQVYVSENKEANEAWYESEKFFNEFIKEFTDTDFSEYITLKTIETILKGYNGRRVPYNILRDYVEDAIDENEDILDLTSHSIQISGAYVLNVEDAQLKNVLTAKVYPAILDPVKDKDLIGRLGKSAVRNREGKYEVKIIPEEKVMIDKFLPYTTIKEEKEKNGKVIKYPIYSFNPKSYVLSMTFFDRRGRDAQFALLMNKKIEYIDPKTKLPIVLNFAQGKNFNKV